MRKVKAKLKIGMTVFIDCEDDVSEDYIMEYISNYFRYGTMSLNNPLQFTDNAELNIDSNEIIIDNY